MKEKMKNSMSMTAILVLIISVAVLGIVLCAMLLLVKTYEESLIRNAETSSRQAVAQVSNTVSSYVTDMHNVMNLLEESFEDSSMDRDKFFDAILRIRPDVVAVTAYDAEGQLRDCWALEHKPRSVIQENLSFDWETAKSFEDGYISQPHVTSIFEGWYPWVVTMAVPISSELPGAWIAMDLSFDSISAYINNIGIGQHGYCYLMDESGAIIYHPQQQLLFSELKQEDTTELVKKPDGVYSEDRVIYAIQTVSNSTWRVVGISYVEELITSKVQETTTMLWMIAALILITAFISSLVLSNALSRPLQGLSRAMQQFEKEAADFSYVPVGGSREVRQLSASFEHMVVQIQWLMERVRQEEINLRKTELKALQAQINPHFLYNTLDSIAWMCEQQRNSEAIQMVNSLARLFRISISRGHELIPIRAELQHAESYLQIQAHRFKDQFQYRFDVDEQLLDFLCNKITLQPIIENAILHGINGLVDKGEIVVTLREDGDDILFVVEDNGVGMEPEQIKAIMRKERSDHTGIGIKNVNDRLKINFGEKYGITIDSELDEGTMVTVRMPRVREEALYENQ